MSLWSSVAKAVGSAVSKATSNASKSKSSRTNDNVKTYTEGKDKYYSDGGKIYKNSGGDWKEVAASNYKYVPTAIGGTRDKAVKPAANKYQQVTNSPAGGQAGGSYYTPGQLNAPMKRVALASAPGFEKYRWEAPFAGGAGMYYMDDVNGAPKGLEYQRFLELMDDDVQTPDHIKQHLMKTINDSATRNFNNPTSTGMSIGHAGGSLFIPAGTNAAQLFKEFGWDESLAAESVWSPPKSAGGSKKQAGNPVPLGGMSANQTVKPLGNMQAGSATPYAAVANANGGMWLPQDYVDSRHYENVKLDPNSPDAYLNDLWRRKIDPMYNGRATPEQIDAEIARVLKATGSTWAPPTGAPGEIAMPTGGMNMEDYYNKYYNLARQSIPDYDIEGDLDRLKRLSMDNLDREYSGLMKGLDQKQWDDGEAQKAQLIASGLGDSGLLNEGMSRVQRIYAGERAGLADKKLNALGDIESNALNSMMGYRQAMAPVYAGLASNAMTAANAARGQDMQNSQWQQDFGWKTSATNPTNMYQAALAEWYPRTAQSQLDTEALSREWLPMMNQGTLDYQKAMAQAALMNARNSGAAGAGMNAAMAKFLAEQAEADKVNSAYNSAMDAFSWDNFASVGDVPTAYGQLINWFDSQPNIPYDMAQMMASQRLGQLGLSMDNTTGYPENIFQQRVSPYLSFKMKHPTNPDTIGSNNKYRSVSPSFNFSQTR